MCRILEQWVCKVVSKIKTHDKGLIRHYKKRVCNLHSSCTVYFLLKICMSSSGELNTIANSQKERVSIDIIIMTLLSLMTNIWGVNTSDSERGRGYVLADLCSKF